MATILTALARTLGLETYAQFLLPKEMGNRIGALSPSYDFDPAIQQNEAEILAYQLRGKTLRIPDLTKVFAHWPCAANPHSERLEAKVDSMLESITTDERKLRGLKRANFARLIALWYPDSSWAELEVAAAYSVWIFVWDDEVDAGGTQVSTDLEHARAYYALSRAHIRRHSGLTDEIFSPKDGTKKTATVRAVHPNLRLFGPVGDSLRSSTDLVQRTRFFQELDNFMEKVEVEHDYRMRGSITTLDGYKKIRCGSVGCAPQIAITDYMLRVRLPEYVMESSAMKSLWHETVVICLILNDIYSCEKEIAQGSLLNLVPVMYRNLPLEKQTLDMVTEEFMALLRQAMENFERGAVSLAQLTSGDDDQTQLNTAAFVKWCRYFITGVLYWSLESPRYNMAHHVTEDGSVSLVL